MAMVKNCSHYCNKSVIKLVTKMCSLPSLIKYFIMSCSYSVEFLIRGIQKGEAGGELVIGGTPLSCLLQETEVETNSFPNSVNRCMLRRYQHFQVVTSQQNFLTFLPVIYDCHNDNTDHFVIKIFSLIHVVLASYFCETSHHKFSSLKQHFFISWTQYSWSLCSEYHRAGIKLLAAEFSSEGLRKSHFHLHSECWQYSSCDCVTEVPVFLLADSSYRCFQFLEATCISFDVAFSIFSQQWYSESF